ncbi:MAG: RraA family protein [Actinomycetes bacterium]
MSLPSSDVERWPLIKSRLFSAAIGDALDAVGRYDQFLPPEIRGITSDMVCVGRAMPVLIGEASKSSGKPFGLLTEALDQLESGEVYVATAATATCAAWGEILTTAARMRSASGAVIDGFHRDTAGILRQGWPVFSIGAYAKDAGPRTAVLDFRTSVDVAGTRINPGDLIFGDRDGVVVVPKEVEDEVLERALAKVSAENEVLIAIEHGMSATAAFKEFGVL